MRQAKLKIKPKVVKEVDETKKDENTGKNPKEAIVTKTTAKATKARDVKKEKARDKVKLSPMKKVREQVIKSTKSLKIQMKKETTTTEIGTQKTVATTKTKKTTDKAKKEANITSVFKSSVRSVRLYRFWLIHTVTSRSKLRKPMLLHSSHPIGWVPYFVTIFCNVHYRQGFLVMYCLPQVSPMI
jgi:hypothetical protein